MCWVWHVLSQLKIFNYAGGDAEVERAFTNEVNPDEKLTHCAVPARLVSADSLHRWCPPDVLRSWTSYAN